MALLDPHSHFDDQQPRTTSWKLRLDVDFDKKVFHGEVTLLLNRPHRGHLDLDSRDLTLHRAFATQTGQEIAFEVGETDPILGQRLRLKLPDNTSQVTLSYDTSSQASGLQWMAPTQTAGKRHPFLFSQCQTLHARSLVPCQDTPLARVSYEADVTVPEDLTVVMSAGPGVVVRKENGKHTFHFTMPQPIPPYLFSIAAAHLASKELSHRSRIWAEPETIEKAAWEFAEVETFIQKAETILGPYDWERFDMLMLPPSFPYGGMENPRMTFLTPTLLAGDRSLVNVVIHELAHSWTGNLITNATADHFWLNEGFTVWTERRILRTIYGKDVEMLQWAAGQKELEDSLARYMDHPELTVLRTDLRGLDPDEVYSTIPYEKGARFIQLLENTLGEKAFSQFLHAYMARFRFTSITTEDFCAFVEEQAPGVLQQIKADAWLHEPGIPDNAPVFRSPKLDAVTALAEGWSTGRRPDDDTIKGWAPYEMLVYLQHLPRPLSIEECQWLDNHLALTGRGNYEILVEWLAIATSSNYEKVFPRLREVLNSVGRMKLLRPLYRAMGYHQNTQAMGREIFAEAAPAYHVLGKRVAEAAIAQWPQMG